MIAKNQSITLTCTALGADFEGICRHDGQVIFVPQALPGETVQARIIKVTKAYAVGKLEKRLADAPERVQPPCPYYPRCGGCTAQHLSYEATLAHKRQQVIDCLQRIGKIDTPNVLETIGMEHPWRYRNKAAFPAGGEPGSPVIGCYAARSHDIVDAKDGCLLQSAQSDSLVRAVREWMTTFKIPSYSEQDGRGLVRHIVTREASDGSAMLLLVTAAEPLPHAGELIALARREVKALRSVILSVNARRTNVILGDTFRTLWGEDAIEDTIAGFSMRVSPRSFFQVNRAQAERLYLAAIDFANLTGRERVWDVYCGCGSITLPLARHAAHVTGIEIVEDAVEDARENARQNGAMNVSFIAGAAEKVLPELVEREGAPDVVVVDPPRKGMELPALEAITKARPERIVYVSCNPATLARDARMIAERGYRAERTQPVDMFGWTGHVECVALLSRV